MEAKEAAARRAVTYVRSGMDIGIGTGSTSAFAIQALGERVRDEGLSIRAVPTSARSQEMAEALHIPLIALRDVTELALTIDGADEVDASLHLIKGGGGALVREKIVAEASRERIIICDASKVKATLGAHPLPVALIPFGVEATLRQLQPFAPTLALRTDADGQPFLTDDGLFICDLHCGAIADPPALESALKRIVGVAEVGLFTGMTTRLVIGYDDGHTEERVPSL